MDPFFFGNQKVVLENSALYGEVGIKNITITGARTAHVKSVRSHFSDNTFRFGATYRIPQIIAEGIYELHCTMAGFRLNGEGTKINLI